MGEPWALAEDVPNLTEVRARIDGADRKALIAERAHHAHRVGKAKGKSPRWMATGARARHAAMKYPLLEFDAQAVQVRGPDPVVAP